MVHDTLPITIKADKEAGRRFPTLGAVCNKLEAQLNFIAMTAGWFADENHEVTLSFDISTNALTATDLVQQGDEVIEIADDAILIFHQGTFHYHGLLSITQPEQQIILQQKAVLPLLLDKKCILMLNVVAQRESLSTL